MYKQSALFLSIALGAIGSLATPTDPFRVYELSAPGIKAGFIAYGARLTHLLVNDRAGKPQDVVIGFDNPRTWVNDTLTDHTYGNAVVGRYANRIKNGTFNVEDETYYIARNDGGVNTLHAGIIGYDQRNWTVVSSSSTSVTMDLFDAGFEGFPGNVTTRATFSVSSPYVNGKRKPTLTIKLTAHALTEVTPIMLTNHIYWNLNAFKVANVLEDHTMQLPLSRRFIETDDRLAANGSIGDVFGDFNGALDFTRAKPIGRDMNDTNYVCSAGCHGYDHCFIVDRAPAQQVRDIVPILNLHSAATGISMQVSSDQQAVQVYTCNWMGGNIPVKSAQIARNAGQGVEFIQKYGCVAIEPHGWVDGINNPYFGQNWDQFYGPRSSAGAAWIRPGAPYVNTQVYSFGTTA